MNLYYEKVFIILVFNLLKSKKSIKFLHLIKKCIYIFFYQFNMLNRRGFKYFCFILIFKLN
jgi:hypothetical protein